jgi:peptidoglycan hydrolase-like protein with peptidoglycan-binding domain
MKTKRWIVPGVVLLGTVGIGCSSNRSGDGGRQAGSGRQSMAPGSQQLPSRSAQASQSSGQMSQADMRKVEQALKDKGYDPGTVDGRIDSQSQQALRDFQKKQNLTMTGLPDQPTVEALGVIIVMPQQ